MAKKKEKLFEDREFDNVSSAQEVLGQSQAKLRRVKIGLIIAAVVSALSIILLIYTNNSSNSSSSQLFAYFLGFFIVIASFVSYIVGGGFGTAIKWAMKIGKFGWFITPFPIDIVTGFFAIIIALIGFLFFPVIFVFMNYKQVKMDVDDAENYLRHCKLASNNNSNNEG